MWNPRLPATHPGWNWETLRQKPVPPRTWPRTWQVPNWTWPRESKVTINERILYRTTLWGPLGCMQDHARTLLPNVAHYELCLNQKVDTIHCNTLHWFVISAGYGENCLAPACQEPTPSCPALEEIPTDLDLGFRRGFSTCSIRLVP